MAKATILVCGGRDFIDYKKLSSTLNDICLKNNWFYGDELENWLPDVLVVSGKAKGADNYAIDWAVCNFCNFLEFSADWDTHGKAAGPIRNQQMLDDGKPDLVVAFPTKNSRGTWDMIRRAEKAGIKTIVVKEE